MIDEIIIWKYNRIEQKFAKNIDLLYHVKQLLNKESLKIINYAYIHYYLNFPNNTWAITYFANLKTIHY